jgi:microcystin-dependent protein
MAYITEVTHTQTTTGNRDFSVTFPFMSTTDLRVQLAGVTKSLNTDYTIVQSGANTVINFNTAPADNATIRIFRDTDIDAINSTYAAGSSIRSTDLNTNNTQLLYAAQEFGTLKEDNSVAFSLGDKGDIQINSSSDWVIQNNTIEQANMADNSVGNNELIDGSITGGKLASLAISTAQLAATAVTTAKIANDAVTIDKLADNAVGTSQIANDAVDPTKINQTTQAGYGFTPAGTVIWYAGSTAPTGYLKCNGDSIPNGSGTVQGVSSNFAVLYAVVGGNIPDLRGEFIRALDDGRNIDQNRGIRTAQTHLTESHNHVATTGTDGAHTHTVTESEDSHDHDAQLYSPNYDNDSGTAKLAGGNYNTNSVIGDGHEQIDEYSHKHNVTVNTTNSAHTHNIAVQNQVGGGTETRPRNVALLACIKY